MKIGIVTYHSDHNYGAMLQAYALQKFIKQQLLADVQIINYIPKVKIHSSHILPKINSLKSLAWCIIKLFYYKSLKRKHNSFEYFWKNIWIKPKFIILMRNYLKIHQYLIYTLPGVIKHSIPIVFIYTFFSGLLPKGINKNILCTQFWI